MEKDPTWSHDFAAKHSFLISDNSSRFVHFRRMHQKSNILMSSEIMSAGSLTVCSIESISIPSVSYMHITGPIKLSNASRTPRSSKTVRIVSMF